MIQERTERLDLRKPRASAAGTGRGCCGDVGDPTAAELSGAPFPVVIRAT